MRRPTISRAAGIAFALGAMSPALAAAPGALDPGTVTGDIQIGAIGAPVVEHKLDVEMTVHDWVLCASQPSARSLVGARERGADAALKAFADLAASKSCGKFTEMQVILQKPVYETLVDSGMQAMIYGALVNISGSWASAFVVYGGLPSEQR